MRNINLQTTNKITPGQTKVWKRDMEKENRTWKGNPGSKTDLGSKLIQSLFPAGTDMQ